jgi:2-polyprenyl-6-hydroxyphenyl methylase / 3-demethylubiquinone-9 3-methyltransferase
MKSWHTEAQKRQPTRNERPQRSSEIPSAPIRSGARAAAFGRNERSEVIGESSTSRHSESIYDEAACSWWTEEIRWIRTLHNMVPARLAYFDRLTDWTGKAVLDLGCAGGFMAEAICDRGARVSGIDPSQRAISAAIAHATMTGRAINYTVGVGEALPYESASHDIVVCVDVLEHVKSVPRILAEVARVLRPDGLFLFDTINRNPLATFAAVTLAEKVLRILPRGAHDPARFIRPSDLRSNLHAAGLRVGRFVGLGPTGLNLRGDLTFGMLPSTAIIYMGTARKEAIK